MIIGGNKDKVIDNIIKNIEDNELNKKVETDDPEYSDEERESVIKHFFDIRKNKLKFKVARMPAMKALNDMCKQMDSIIEVDGLDNIPDNLTKGIVTCNHFNPMDNIIVRKAIKEKYNKDIYIVVQDTNLSLPGELGYFVTHSDVIPLSKSPSQIINVFTPELERVLSNNNFVLIYPEEEMWVNYRKPRPCKRGSYQFAHQLNVPVISCFTELVDMDEDDNEQFKQTRYKLHILGVIYPDLEKGLKSDSLDMADQDYKLKCEAYEKAYGKKLDYKFDYSDIAGLKVHNGKEVNK